MHTSLPHIFSQKPLIISGPCSAETEQQLMATAKELAGISAVNLMRAGIWKPRTRPGNFEGVGKIGLEWLRNAKKETGLPVTVEVANALHVEQALSYDVDVLWIGARTTANPFSVQEIASSLQGTNIPVLIKNPVNPDIELWCGAVERIRQAGIHSIGLIHRGFSSVAGHPYRNPPLWQLAIEMKRRYRDIMMICDPSHICGNRTHLQEVAQKSINLDFQGLMIESHIHPENAWSDSEQQITPARLKQMLDELIWRNIGQDDRSKDDKLSKLREQIDQLDEDLIQMLSNRMKLAEEIGAYKKDQNITILQTERWDHTLKKALQKAASLGLSEEFVIRYFESVHLESINHQNKMMNE